MMTDTNISRKNLLHRIHRRLGMYAWKMGLLGYFFCLFVYLLRQNLILLPRLA